MRTVTFKSVLTGSMALAGLTPGESPAGTPQRYAEFINQRMREGWNHAAWPELVIPEERSFRPAWLIGETYAAGDEVYFSADGTRAYYRANLAPNTPAAGESPDSHPGKWSVFSDFPRFIPLDQPGESPIETVLGASERDPRQPSPGPVRWIMSNRGVELPGYGGPTIWLRFRLRPSVFSATPYNVATAYAPGDLCYDETTGQCYRARQATTGHAPPDAVYWAVVPFPYVLESFVKRAAYADILGEDGDTGTSARESNRAYKFLLDAEDIELPAQSQYTTATASTY